MPSRRLLWIGFKLLKEEEEESEHVASAAGLRSALTTILTADFVISTDNILAAVAIAHGDIVLLASGLALSIPLLVFAGSIVASLINRLWWLVYLGSGLIAWTGGEMIIEDQYAHDFVAGWGMQDLAGWSPALSLVSILGFAHWFHRHRDKVAVAIRPGARGQLMPPGEVTCNRPCSRGVATRHVAPFHLNNLRDTDNHERKEGRCLLILLTQRLKQQQNWCSMALTASPTPM